MDTCVRKDIKLKYQGSIEDVCKNIELYLKTLDKTCCLDNIKL